MWNDIVNNENPELWNKITSLAKTSKQWDIASQEIKNNKEVYPEDKYQEGTFAFENEVMARLLGKKGAEMFDNTVDQKTWKDTIKEFFDSIKKFLGFDPSTKNFEDLTVDEMLTMAVDEIVTGNPLSNFGKLKNTTNRNWFKKTHANISPSYKASIIPEYSALQKLRDSYRENKDLSQAIIDSYEIVKNKMSIDEWADFVSKAVRKVEAGKSKTLAIAY